jgi:hypothetical protein
MLNLIPNLETVDHKYIWIIMITQNILLEHED